MHRSDFLLRLADLEQIQGIPSSPFILSVLPQDISICHGPLRATNMLEQPPVLQEPWRR